MTVHLDVRWSTGTVRRMPRPTLPGHDLLHTGSAVDAENLPTGTKTGPAACACGETSEDLPSTGARRAWHRNHVAEVRHDLDDADDTAGLYA